MMMDGLMRAVGVGVSGVEGVAAVDDDMGGEGIQCHDHRLKNTTSGGGICAFCLQEKLGKLVSSSSSSFFGSSSAASPSLRSESLGPVAALGLGSISNNRDPSLPLAVAASASSSNSNGNRQQNGGGASVGSAYAARRTRIPFLVLTAQKKMKKKAISGHDHSSSAAMAATTTALKRSKSTSTPRLGGGNPFLPSEVDDYSPRKRGGFWSFLYPSKPTKIEKEKTSSSSSSRDLRMADTTSTTTAPGPVQSLSTTLSSFEKQHDEGGGASISSVSAVVVVDESADSPNSSSSNATSFGRKVSRSRSVGCGSRSFSGDLFERISTGFGDCTLRRVESQREGGRRSSSVRRSSGEAMIKERVRCGGIFGTFMMTSSSYFLSGSSVEDDGHHHHHHSGSEKGAAGMRAASSSATTPLVHGRISSWGWAFASPIRAFGSSMKDGRVNGHKNNRSGGGNNGNGNGKGNSNTTTRTPNLAAIPSLLAVRS